VLRRRLLRHIDLGGELADGARPGPEHAQDLHAPRLGERPEREGCLSFGVFHKWRYNPAVRSATVRGARRTGVGAERACELLPKGRVVERVTHWEDGRAVGLEVAESDWPIHFMRWVTRLEPAGAATRITQSLEYEVRFGPVGWLLDHLVMRRRLTSTLDEMFASLVKRAEERE
jgi:Polyketide cyclase / dehydrase and lipid transport